MIAYIITNTTNGRQYVGVTKRSVARRWWEHKRTTGLLVLQPLGKAIAKYGSDAFTIEVIASAKTMLDLMELERLLIAQHDTLAPNGYNLTSGGYGMFKPADNLRANIGAHLRGKPRPAEVAAKISASHMGMLATDEAREKNAASHRGKTLSAEIRANMATAGLARAERERIAGKPPRSAEHCAKLAAARIGKKADDDTKAKMSASRIGKKKPPGAYTQAGIASRIYPDRVLTKTEIMARYRARRREAKGIALME